MPLYEYVCQECSARFEKLVRASQDDASVVCPSCGATHATRAFSTFATSGTARSAAPAPSSAACGPVG
ncbi:MAG: zinc ribbon domain-containing protein [Chloroflexi bacterium]|nr:zinc ribbon domain-containing protein [Chloroflexota bacterium]